MFLFFFFYLEFIVLVCISVVAIAVATFPSLMEFFISLRQLARVQEVKLHESSWPRRQLENQYPLLVGLKSPIDTDQGPWPCVKYESTKRVQNF